VRVEAERAVRERRMDLEESAQLMRFYVDSINGYTYLEDGGE
jgi:arginine decarboxylase-like protein